MQEFHDAVDTAEAVLDDVITVMENANDDVVLEAGTPVDDLQPVADEDQDPLEQHDFVATFRQVTSEGLQNLISDLRSAKIDAGKTMNEALGGLVADPMNNDPMPLEQELQRPLPRADYTRLLRRAASETVNALCPVPLRYAIPGMGKLLDTLEYTLKVPVLEELHTNGEDPNLDRFLELNAADYATYTSKSGERTVSRAIALQRAGLPLDYIPFKGQVSLDKSDGSII